MHFLYTDSPLSLKSGYQFFLVRSERVSALTLNLRPPVKIEVFHSMHTFVSFFDILKV
jgi:hypothetical protein